MVTRLGPGPEFDLIRRFLNDAGRTPPDHRLVLVGPGDDCAVIDAAPLAITMDMAVEGIHFRRDWLEPEEVGYRAAAAAASDLAAMAATPIGLFVSIAVQAADATDYAAAVMRGIGALGGSVGAALLGGDLARTTGPLVLDVVAVGRAVSPVERSGARPGDAVWVTGALGGAAAAVAAWTAGDEPPAAARSAFARPRPRTEEASWLAERAPLHALIDLSDGLGGDLGHIAAASGVGAIIDAETVPVHPGTREVAGEGPEALAMAVGGGEDYELCLVAPAGAVESETAAFRDRFGIDLVRVGHIRAGDGVALRWPDGREERVTGYQHFGRGS